MRGDLDLGRIVLALHGDERQTQGGPSIRAPEMARRMCAMGLDARILRMPDPDVMSADIVHGFNVWNPETALAVARRVRRMDRPLVFSPIFLDLSETDLWNRRLLSLFEQGIEPDRLDHRIGEEVRRFSTDPQPISPEPLAGYRAMVRELIDLADHVVHLSRFEQRALQTIGAQPRASTIIHNPVDADAFIHADPSIFRKRYGLHDFVLCVARVEPRKNQLMLLHALRNTTLPVVLVGAEPNAAYSALLDGYGGERIHRLGRLDREDGMLQSALAAARVVVLPSWSEGAPLSALEAAAAGASLVLSNRSGEAEYFGDHALYCDPGDPASILKAVLNAWERPEPARQSIQTFVRENYSWERHVEATMAVYRQVHAREPSCPSGTLIAPVVGSRLFVLDALPEAMDGRAPRRQGHDYRPALQRLEAERVAWVGDRLEVAAEQMTGAGANRSIRGGDLVVLHEAGGFSRGCVEEIRSFAERNGLRLTVLCDGAGFDDLRAGEADDLDVFQALACDASRLVCASAEAGNIVESFCLTQDIVRPRIDVLPNDPDEAVLARLLGGGSQPDLDDVYLPGSCLSLGRDAPRRGLVLEEGWRHRDEDAVWSEALTAGLRLKPRIAGLSVLAFSARMPVQGADIGVCVVECDGIEIGRAVFGDASPRTFAFALQRPTLSGDVSVVLRVDRLRSETEAGKSVGIALGSVALEQADEAFLSLQEDRALVMGRRYDLTRWTSASFIVAGASQNQVWGMSSGPGLTRLVLPRADVNESAERPLRLHIRGRPVASAQTPLHAKVMVNGRPIGSIDAVTEDVLDWVFDLPEIERGFSHRIVDIVGDELRGASRLGIGEADRAFVLGVFNVMLTRDGENARPPSCAAPLMFGFEVEQSVRDEALTPGEWHPCEAQGRWSNGSSASVRVTTPMSSQDGFIVKARVNLGPQIQGGGRQVWMRVGGRKVAALRLGEGEVGTLEGFVPASAVHEAVMEVWFSTDAGFNPWIHLQSPDDRRLGLHLHQIHVQPGRRVMASWIFMRLSRLARRVRRLARA